MLSPMNDANQSCTCLTPEKPDAYITLQKHAGPNRSCRTRAFVVAAYSHWRHPRGVWIGMQMPDAGDALRVVYLQNIT